MPLTWCLLQLVQNQCCTWHPLVPRAAWVPNCLKQALCAAQCWTTRGIMCGEDPRHMVDSSQSGICITWSPCSGHSGICAAHSANLSCSSVHACSVDPGPAGAGTAGARSGMEWEEVQDPWAYWPNLACRPVPHLACGAR